MATKVKKQAKSAPVTQPVDSSPPQRSARRATRVSVTGRLVADPELRHTSSGVPVARLRLVSNGTPAGHHQDVIVRRRLAEVSTKYLSRGRRVRVEGRLEGREWVGRDGIARYDTNVIAERVVFLHSEAA
jgi:single-strand DNA-binding protein